MLLCPIEVLLFYFSLSCRCGGNMHMHTRTRTYGTNTSYRWGQPQLRSTPSQKLPKEQEENASQVFYATNRRNIAWSKTSEGSMFNKWSTVQNQYSQSVWWLNQPVACQDNVKFGKLNSKKQVLLCTISSCMYMHINAAVCLQLLPTSTNTLTHKRVKTKKFLHELYSSLSCANTLIHNF